MVTTQVSHADTLAALNAYFSSVKARIEDLLRDVCGKYDMPEQVADRVTEYYSRCIDYNIVGGKLARARTVCETLKFLSDSENSEVDPALFEAASVLGWCVEILQAFFLIEDDVMDRGESRRGKPCWYRNSDIGIANAINDGLLLEQVLYELIELNEKTRPFAVQAHRKLRDAAMRTVIGQHLDTCPPSDVREFTRDQWLSVVRFKTAFYTFYLPCELGILISGVRCPDTDLKLLREICLLLGEFFQAQDDMLDCYGDPAVIGKIGRDIEEGKCTWLWYTALDITSNNPSLQSELVSLYSSESRSSDPAIAACVKQIYKEIGVQEIFADYSTGLIADINTKISGLESPGLRRLCNWLLESTTNRKK